jgi:hypothetical protein
MSCSSCPLAPPGNDHHRRRRRGAPELSGHLAAAGLAAAAIREETAAVDRLGEDIDALLAACATAATPPPAEAVTAKNHGLRASATAWSRGQGNDPVAEWAGGAWGALL